ncbi:hypothetical protein FOFC_10372 [Fusarium oxysporum]|nr:hypothetical protein FOFC_10372 [Fusarium oxysporum]
MCEMSPLANEDVKGPMKELPGGDGVPNGDGSDVEQPDPTDGAHAPTLTYSPGDRPENSASPLPGQKPSLSTDEVLIPTIDAGDVGAAAIKESTIAEPLPASAKTERLTHSSATKEQQDPDEEVLCDQEEVVVTPSAAPAAAPPRSVELTGHGHHII